jgi:serine/threonine protein kinase
VAKDLPIKVGMTVRSRSSIGYRVLQFLGSGGNSLVFLVLAMNGQTHGVLFALKVFTRLSKPERLDRFEQEAEFLRECTHPAIMRIYDSGTYDHKVTDRTERYPFVIVDYLPQTLDQLISGLTTTAERVSYTLQLLSALAYLDHHNPSVVHRDVKPKNIFVKGRSCVLGDFGLMKFLNENDGIDREIYREAAGPGMPYYHRSPDLVAYAKGEAELTTKSDVFQLGLVVAELFTGTNPAQPPKDILDPVVLRGLEPPNISGALGSGIHELVQLMLIFDERDRPRAVDLIDRWEGIFREIVDRSHDLNGRVF